MAKILMVVNNPAFFLSHRLPIALAAKQAGHDVHIVTMVGESVKTILAAGLKHHALPMSRSGTNPLQELKTLMFLYRLFRQEQPDLVHLVTIKPVLYGGIAARLAKVKGLVYAISGLGFIFTRQRGGLDLLKTAAVTLYKLALGHPNSKVIVQNQDDQKVLEQIGALRANQAVLIKGSGVDMQEFVATPEPPEPVVVTMAARLLKDKGVMEYGQAARLAREAGDHTSVWQLAGSLDPGNPASLNEQELSQISEHLQVLGERHDIAQLYAQSHIVVLPSYREGIPKSLLEAAASARPIVTSDVPGCRDAIIAHKTGELVPVKDAQALSEAIQGLIKDKLRRQAMGKAGRELAEEEFALPTIVEQHMALYQVLLNKS